jgi:hypothetical protein
MQTGALYNFIKDPSTNSLKYTGSGGRFHAIATFDFVSESGNNTCGFYIGKNTDPASGLSADADRISESEIYIDSSSPSKPVAGAIQTIVDLETDDRIFFIVQNKSAARNITVEFMKFIAVPLTSERGATGVNGTSVSNADVNTNGDLIITLTDSTTINAGNVVGVNGATGAQGPAGETGATGPQGPQGEPGLQDDVISLYIDGTPDVISTGKKAFRLIPYDCEVVEWYVVASVAGTIEFDVRASSFASYPSTTSIVGTTSDYPSLNNEVKNSNTSVTGWDVLNAGDMVDLYITSNTDIQSVGLFIKIRRIT